MRTALDKTGGVPGLPPLDPARSAAQAAGTRTRCGGDVRVAKHLVIAIDWYGPYTAETAKGALADYGPGLYAAIGKQTDQTSQSLQYVGLSSRLRGRVGPGHHKLGDVTQDLRLWLGEAGTANPSGRRTKFTTPTLDYSEWLLAYFVRFALNDKKTKNPPDRPVTLLNRWYHTDYQTPWVKRPHPDWPDLIDFIGPGYDTKVVWFGKKMKRVRPLLDG